MDRRNLRSRLPTPIRRREHDRSNPACDALGGILPFAIRARTSCTYPKDIPTLLSKIRYSRAYVERLDWHLMISYPR